MIDRDELAAQMLAFNPGLGVNVIYAKVDELIKASAKSIDEDVPIGALPLADLGFKTNGSVDIYEKRLFENDDGFDVYLVVLRTGHWNLRFSRGVIGYKAKMGFFNNVGELKQFLKVVM